MGIPLIRKMFLVINKKLLTHASIRPLSFAVSLKIFLERFPIRRNIVKDKLMKFLREEDGLTIVEYAVAAGLITAAVAASFALLGGSIDAILVLLNGYLAPAP